MIHTFKGIQDQVLAWLDERDDDGTTRRNVKNAINTAHQNRLTAYPWPHMVWDRPETLTVSASVQVYALHQEFSRPIYFRNRRTGEWLVETPARNMEASGADWFSGQDTDMNRFVLWGRWPVAAQPTSASVLTIVSSSASDTGSTYQILVRGVDSSGAVVSETITPSGQTPVNSSYSYVKVLSVTKAGTWNGTLTITSNSDAVTILTLLDCEFGRQYPLIWLLYTPVAGDVIEYKFYRQPLLLVNDFDIPEIPAPFTQILVWDALMLLYSYDGQLDGPRAATVSRQQKQIEDAMMEALWEGQSLGAEPRFIRDRRGAVNPAMDF